MYSKILIRKTQVNAINRKHPWVFSGAIWEKDKNLKNGDIVQLWDYKDQFLAIGYYQNSSIAVRILSWKNEEIDQSFWDRKIEDAILLRLTCNLNDAKTNCFRLINGEGDGISGLIIDYYNGHLVYQCHTEGITYHLDKIQATIEKQELLGFKSHFCIQNKFEKTKTKIKENTQIVVKENDISFEVDPANGQKTGLFLDQRLNRELISKYAHSKKVLNLFCYTGGFSLYALSAGASEVVSVDISEFATSSIKRNIELNGFESKSHSIVKQDVKKYINEVEKGYFDIIIVDPPAFAKHRNKKHNAINAYKRLNIKAFEKIVDKGLIFTFSCSQVVDTPTFEHTIRAAAIESGKDIQILHYLSQAPDHPTNIYHQEGRYLKGLVLRVQ